MRNAELEYFSGEQPQHENPENRQQIPQHMPDKDSARTSDAGLLARQCQAIMHTRCMGLDDDQRVQALQDLCTSQGVDYPRSRWGIGPSVMRLCDPKWWARQIWKRDRRAFEAELIRAGHVKRGGQLYCSDEAVTQWKAQRRHNQEYLQQVFAFNDDGYVADLADIASKSLANPEVRRAEMIARIKGMANYASDMGHVCLFATITCPSRFHVASARYDGSTPREGQMYLRGVWARIRAHLNRLDCRVYFMRIAEPHNDGTPHWHVVLFCPAYQANQVRNAVHLYAREADASELTSHKAKKARSFIETISGDADQVVGYVIKYVSKNIDGKKANGESMGTTKDRDGNAVGDAVDTASRVLAWASLWGIRQFQQGGAPLVGPYRELRRIRWIIEASEVMERARRAADSGDFAEYMRQAEASDLATVKQCEALDHLKAGRDQLAAESLNDYNEPVFRVHGVRSGDYQVITRSLQWQIMRAEAIEAAWRAADTADIKVMFDCVRAEVARIKAARAATSTAQPCALDLCQ